MNPSIICLPLSDMIDIISVIVDGISIIVAGSVAIWVVNTIQKRIDNQRSIKNHLIDEVIEIRRSYREIINQTTCGELRPKDIKSRLRVLSSRITDLINLINIQFKPKVIDKDFLLPYQLDLNQIITDDENFSLEYKANRKFLLTQRSQEKMAVFSAEKDHLFNELIVKINKAE